MSKDTLNEAQAPAYFPHRETSETAASAHNRKFPDGGVQTYRVLMQTAGGLTFVDVDAATGDEAAEKGLATHLGAKVTNVSPAPKKAD